MIISIINSIIFYTILVFVHETNLDETIIYKKHYKIRKSINAIINIIQDR